MGDGEDAAVEDEDEGEGRFECDLYCYEELGPISPAHPIPPAAAAAGAGGGGASRAGSLAPLRPCALAPFIAPSQRSPRSKL